MPQPLESLTLTPVTCSVSVALWFIQLSEDHLSADDRSAPESTQQQSLLGQAVISLSRVQTEEVRAEAPITDLLLTNYKGGLAATENC